jgi:uncharacterized protein YndB with AHSA1/START domain
MDTQRKKTMTDLTIEREILIEAPAEVVWRTITEPEQVAQWFADRVELDARPGGNGTLVFEDTAHSAALVVETVDPPHRFTFRWGHPDGDAAVPGNSVLVEFTLTAEGDERTRLRVAETGLDAIGWPDDDKARYADEHRNGWVVILGRLADLFATPAG